VTDWLTFVSFEHFLPLSFIRFMQESPPPQGGGLFRFPKSDRPAVAALLLWEGIMQYCANFLRFFELFRISFTWQLFCVIL
jgi:hypothetical protein